MFVNTRREDIMNVLSYSRNVLLVSKVYGSGISFTFPISIPAAAILVINDDIIIIDNRSKWVNGHGNYSLIVAKVIYIDGLNVFADSKMSPSVSDFNVPMILQDIEEKGPNRTYVPPNVAMAVKYGCDMAAKVPPYMPVIDYKNIAAIPTATKSLNNPFKVLPNVAPPLETPINNNKVSDENIDSGYITFKTLPY